MFQRTHKLLIDLPEPDYGDKKAALVVQELLGGKFGELSTLNNCLFQSFNFRERKKLKPFYDLVSSITAEELGHVELVSHTINLLFKDTTTVPFDVNDTALKSATAFPHPKQFIHSANTSLPIDATGNGWTGDNVFSSGNLVLDLLHNFFLEIGTRTHKMRVYEMTDHPTRREMIGYLLVRGGTHVVAYQKAIESLTGVSLANLLPIPDISNRKFNTAKKFEDQGLGNVLYSWNEVGDYLGIEQIFTRTHPETNQPLTVKEGTPIGGEMPDLDSLPEFFAPGLDRDDYNRVAKHLMNHM